MMMMTWWIIFYIISLGLCSRVSSITWVDVKLSMSIGEMVYMVGKPGVLAL